MAGGVAVAARQRPLLQTMVGPAKQSLDVLGVHDSEIACS